MVSYYSDFTLIVSKNNNNISAYRYKKRNGYDNLGAGGQRNGN